MTADNYYFNIFRIDFYKHLMRDIGTWERFRKYYLLQSSQVVFYICVCVMCLVKCVKKKDPGAEDK